MKDRLISMLDFVLEINTTIPKNADTRHHYINIVRYAKFLRQPLTLGMFVPVSEAGEVMKEPLEDNYNLGDIHAGYFRKYLDAYNKAKSRCLFEGFEVKNGLIFIHFNHVMDVNKLKNLRIEDAVGEGLTLTPYAKELIYGN